MTESPTVVVERRVDAVPAAVYAFLTESDRWAAWQGAAASIEPTPGGLFRMQMANGATARGQFVELVENRRVVFTWGWIDMPGIPPGSTVVEIDLLPDGDGTLIRLTHRDLPPDEIARHTAGWHHYVHRLAARAQGFDPGPDQGPDGGAAPRDI